jgi:hypothetical protein
MKKIRRAEFLLAVAIITSAAVMQIREHTLKVPSASNANAPICESTQPGLALASCMNTRNEKSVEGSSAARHAVSQIWV